MRVVTLGGFVRETFLLPSTSNLEYYMKRDLTASGWGVKSVSITRQSIWNNFSSIVIEINASNNDDNQRIKNGVKSFLDSYDPDNTNSPIFYDVTLNVTKDTGIPVASGGISMQQPPKTSQTINQGILGVVTVKASDSEKEPNKNPIPKEYLYLGGFLLFILLLRR